MKKDNIHELGKRLLLTASILVIYMVGRSLLLYQVDGAAYQLEEINSQNIILSMISGDRHRYTVFALGIMPYITASLLIWVYTALRGSEFRARLSPQKMERHTLLLMLVIAVISAISCAGDLIFQESSLDVRILRAIAFVELISGAVVIYKLANLNKERGIGGQTPMILVNILDNFITTIRSFTWEQIRWPAVLCVIMAVVILMLESVIIRIHVQRVSIHNSYADKSYIAFMLIPIGVMPVMFAASVFMLVQMLFRFLVFIDEDNLILLSAYENMSMTNAVGAAVYLGIIFLLNLIFSFLMIAPGEMAEQLQRGGDSIINVYAGKKTKRYLRRKLLLLTVISGSLLCVMMGFSLGLSFTGEISSELSLFPATAMILVGLLYPIYREVRAYWKFDSYSFFI